MCLGKYLYNLNREKNNNLPRYILTKKEKEFLSKQNLKSLEDMIKRYRVNIRYTKSPKKTRSITRTRREKGCSKQSTKKYKSRKSPPYPANKCCNSKKKGNDGKMYLSKKKGRSCRWSKISKK